MRILIVSNLYPPYERGGAELVVAKEARELRDQGHQVAVLTTIPYSGFSSLLPKPKNEEGVYVLRYFPLNLFWYRNDFKHILPVRLIWHVLDMFNIHACSILHRTIKRFKPDQIRTHNMKGIGLCSGAAIAKSNIEWVHFLHDVQLLTPRGLLFVKGQSHMERDGILAKLYRYAVLRVFKTPKFVHGPSQWILDIHKSYGFFKSSKKKRVQWYQNPSDVVKSWQLRVPLKLLFVGQVAQHKGVLFLLEVLNRLPQGSYMLDVVGDGPLMEKVKAQARSNPAVTMHGRLSMALVRQKLQESDILVFPSLAHENCPTVIVEALSYNVPILSGDVGGVKEMVVNEKNGWIVEAGVQKAWENKLKSIMGIGV